jgi:ribonucleotide monophosphatase NagD (HAD superfamily)
MLDLTVEIYGLDRQACYVVGDRWTDMLAGINAGMNIILVTAGCGREALEQNAGRWDTGKASHISPSLSDAAGWIVLQKGCEKLNQ